MLAIYFLIQIMFTIIIKLILVVLVRHILSPNFLNVGNVN